jgi:hypothetical protein
MTRFIGPVGSCINCANVEEYFIPNEAWPDNLSTHPVLSNQVLYYYERSKGPPPYRVFDPSQRGRTRPGGGAGPLVLTKEIYLSPQQETCAKNNLSTKTLKYIPGKCCSNQGDGSVKLFSTIGKCINKPSGPIPKPKPPVVVVPNPNPGTNNPKPPNPQPNPKPVPDLSKDFRLKDPDSCWQVIDGKLIHPGIAECRKNGPSNKSASVTKKIIKTSNSLLLIDSKILSANNRNNIKFAGLRSTNNISLSNKELNKSQQILALSPTITVVGSTIQWSVPKTNKIKSLNS